MGFKSLPEHSLGADFVGGSKLHAADLRVLIADSHDPSPPPGTWCWWDCTARPRPRLIRSTSKGEWSEVDLTLNLTATIFAGDAAVVAGRVRRRVRVWNCLRCSEIAATAEVLDQGICKC